MTLKEFEEKIVEIAADGDYSYQYQEIGKRDNHGWSKWVPVRRYDKYVEKKHVLYSEWSTGGKSGGNCWNDDEPKHYSSDNQPKELTLLDVILEGFNPNITFLEYKCLTKSVVKHGTRSEGEYYGNSTDYSYYMVEIEELYDYMNKRGWLDK